MKTMFQLIYFDIFQYEAQGLTYFRCFLIENFDVDRKVICIALKVDDVLDNIKKIFFLLNEAGKLMDL